MKLKIFSFLIAFCAVVMTANAQIDIEGIYSGEVVINSSDFEEPLVQSENIIVVKTGDLYTLKINQFALLDPETQEPLMLIGDIEFAEVEASLQGGNIVLSRAGISNGPVVYEIMPTTIELTSCVITPSGEMSVDLLVTAYFPLDSDAIWDINNIDPNVWMALINVEVAFTGSKMPTSVFSPKANRISIFSNTATDEIMVKGFENADFSIFNLSGNLVKSGNLSAETINVSALNAGVYVLNINGVSALFIRK